jgi:hypothetical protein
MLYYFKDDGIRKDVQNVQTAMSYHLNKNRYSKEGFLMCFEEGYSEKRNSFLKEMEVKYNTGKNDVA